MKDAVTRASRPETAQWPVGDGEMAVRIRAHDWAATPLGPIEAWPAELKSAAAFVLDSAFPTALVWGPGLVTLYNDGFRPILGGKPEALGRSFAEIWSEAWHEIGPIAERALAGEATFIEDYPLVINRTGEPEQAFFTFSYSPVRAADGSIIGLIDTVVETTKGVLARERLRHSEERLRRMLETDAVGLLFFDHDGVLIDANDVFLNMTGWSREDVASRSLDWRKMTPPEWIAESEAQLQRLAEIGRTGPYEKEYFRKDGSRSWMLFAGRDLGDGTLVEFGIDIEDRKRAEAALRASESHAKLLLAELQHRVRNTLSVVRSIARRTADTSETVGDYAMHLEGRLNAFARVQAAVTRNPTSGIDLTMLVADELLAHGAHEGERVRRLQGPKVRLQPRAAETFALAIHELATNAVKYGALAAEEGRIDVEWMIEKADGAGRLVFNWVETGVKVSDKKLRRGFGTELIERTLAYELGGDTSLHFDPDGLRCTIRLPVNEGLTVIAAHGA
jgi:PAS domain S-box-containing protein